MLVWAAFPSVDPEGAEETARRWASIGFRTCLLLNKEKYRQVRSDLVFTVDAYEGYFRSMNFLCQKLTEDHRADVVVCIGDRIFPPEGRGAHEIATSFAARFPNGVGVMQPTGGAEDGCPSPWIGRNFIKKMYGGKGPFYERYFQYFGGKELAAVANQMGVLWRRNDLTQPRVPKDADANDFFRKHNREQYFERDASIFAEREKDAFLGFEVNRIVTATSSMLPKLRW